MLRERWEQAGDEDESEEPADLQELADEVPVKCSTVNVSDFLKSANRMNKSLSTTMNSEKSKEFISNKLSCYRSRNSFQDTENIDPNDPTMKLRMQLHESHKREANQRLQLSRLKSCVDNLTKESHRLQQELLQAQAKFSKSNEYILKLDNQLRSYREEVERYRKRSNSQSRHEQLMQENKDLRFVIEELLRQREEEQRSTHRNSFDRRQNVTELMRDLRTYPSSESSRGSTRKPSPANVFEFTMNPRSFQQAHLLEQPEMSVDSQALLEERIRTKVLSVINENIDDESSKAPTDDYIRSRINELASFNQSASCGRSLMYVSIDG